MQVWGEDFENDPEYQAGMVEFSCTQTFQGQGPDGGPAAYEACCNRRRSCYREFDLAARWSESRWRTSRLSAHYVATEAAPPPGSSNRG